MDRNRAIEMMEGWREFFLNRRDPECVVRIPHKLYRFFLKIAKDCGAYKSRIQADGFIRVYFRGLNVHKI